MAGPGIPLNLDFYRPPSRPATPLTARGASGGYAPPILTMPPPSAPTPSAPQSIATPMGSIPAHGPYARSAPSNAEPAFEFTVPSLPPRLANFGRKISQMSTDFMAEFDDGPPTRQSLERAQSQAQRAPSLGDTVPGMGDEPVMCPFCEKPLPPALLAGHAQDHGPGSKAAGATAAMKTTSSLAGPALKRSNTTTAVQPRGSLRSEGARKAGLLDPLPVEEGAAPRSSSVPAAKSGDKDTVVPVPTISAEEMRREEAEADGTNASSGKIVVSDADIRRWSRMAGIEPPKTPAAAKTSGPSAETQLASAPVGGPTVPKLDPPPASGRPSASRASSSSSKFGFFGRKANPKKDIVMDDDSDEEGGQASGYSRLLAGGSDTESDVEGEENGQARSRTRRGEKGDKLEVLHDEPGHMTPEEGTVADADIGKAASSSAPAAQDSPVEVVETSPKDLKHVLREVLAKLNEMSQSHTALHSSQTSLLTSLKIARSNLAMAEANTEMLEAQLKQQQKATASPAPVSAPGLAQPRTSGVPATPVAQPRAVPASATIPGRPENERQSQRPMSLQMPAGTSAPEKGGWGFWNNGKKKLQDAAQAFPANFPSPTMEKRSLDFEQYVAGSSSAANGTSAAKSKEVSRLSSEGGSGMVRSASYSNLDAARSPPRTSSLGQNAVGSAASTAHAAELAKVRELYATAEKKIDAMSKELAELKKGKVEMEAELENLSQALFEEANKMVADERKKRAEVEESLKEVKEEREALKQTIKVLDGRGAADDNASVKSAKSSRSVAGADASPGDEDLPDEFVPRDLDKHYEALRRSIHHVSDGAGDAQGSGLLNALAVPETIPEDTVADSGSAAGPTAESTEHAEDEVEQEQEAVAASVPTVAPPLDPNPWANPSPFGTAEPSGLEAKLPGEDQLRVRSSNEAPRSPAEDLDRLMERLQEDMKD